MPGVKDSRTSRRPKPSHVADRGNGMVIPTPTSGAPVKVYQHPTLEGNGTIPSGTFKGLVTRTKPIPGTPDELA